MELQLESIQEIVGYYVSFYGLKVLFALLIFFVGKFLAGRIIKIVKSLMLKGKVDPTLVSFLGNVVYALVLAFVIIAALSQLGINTTSLAAVMAAAGLAIGLALKDSLSNLAAGVMIILFRPFKIGDYVEIAGISGTVEEISIFTTILKSPDNKKIITPNGAIISDNITNYSAKPTRRVDMVFGVGYDDDLKKVKETLERIVREDDRVLKDPEPVVALHELADSSVNFVVRPWVNTADYWTVYWDLNFKVKTEFDKAGISIPYPQRDLHIVSDVNLDAGKPANEAPKKKAPAKKKSTSTSVKKSDAAS